MSSTAVQLPPDPDQPPTMSDKAKGKRREEASEEAHKQQDSANRRTTRSANAAAVAAAAEKDPRAGSHSHDPNEASDEDDAPLLPLYTTLLFTTAPPSSATITEAPVLPTSVQQLIETPECKLLDDMDMPSGRLRPGPGQQNVFDDAWYAKRHAPGEALERKARKQERERLISERNRLRQHVDQLKSEIASAAFYNNASPVKTGHKTTVSLANDRLREGEKSKRRQLHEAEAILRKYEELLQPRESQKTQANQGNAGGSHRKGWTASNKAALSSTTASPSHPYALTNGDAMHGGGYRRAGSASVPASNKIQPIQVSFSNKKGSGTAARPAGSVSISIIPPRAPSSSSSAGSGPHNNRTATGLASGSGSTSKAGRVPRPLTQAFQAGASDFHNPGLRAAADVLAKKRKGKKRRRGHESDGDDGKDEAIAMMDTSHEFMTQEDIDNYEGFRPGSSVAYSSNHTHGLPPPDSSGAEDYDSDDFEFARQRRPMTQEERDNYWVYKGPKTIVDSFFRANNQALAAAAPSPPGSTSNATPTPGRRSTRVPMAFGHKVPEAACATKMEFNIDSILKPPKPKESPPQSKIVPAMVANQSSGPVAPPMASPAASAPAPAPAPASAPAPAPITLAPVIQRPQHASVSVRPQPAPAPTPVPSRPQTTSAPARPQSAPAAKAKAKPHPTKITLPAISIQRAQIQTPPTSMLPAAAKYPRAGSTRSVTPQPNMHPNGYAQGHPLHQRRRVPRVFRIKPVPYKAFESKLYKRAALTGMAARNKADNVFESEGELSSVSSDSDGENEDSDAKFRQQRATRQLENADTTYPTFLNSAQGSALPSSAAALESAKTASLAGTPEPDSAIAYSYNGMKVRKRIRLDDFPTNELIEVDGDQMATLRDAYVHASGKYPERLGPGIKEQPLGEWQVPIAVSYIRDS